MARKRTNPGSAASRVIASGASRGHTAAAIAEQLRGLGITMSARTVGRRLRELRGRVRMPRLSKGGPTGPARARGPSSTPIARRLDLADLRDDAPLPEGLDLPGLYRLLIEADKAATAAFDADDLVAFAALARLVARLAEEIRKTAPTATVAGSELEDWPDMAAPAERARTRLFGRIAEVTGEPPESLSTGECLRRIT